MKKCFEVTENVIKLKFKETGLRYDQKCFYLDNPGQSIWNKIEKSSKLKMTCRFHLVNVTLNVRATQNKGKIWGVLEN